MKRIAWTLSLALLLLGCSTAAPPGGSATPEPKTPPPAATAPAATLPAPEAARRPPEELLTQGGVYYGCNVPADCEIKDVGNCCGYYPACVNKDSPTFPEQVKADCAKEGLNSICGFPTIASCDCVEGRCSNVTGPSAASQDVK